LQIIDFSENGTTGDAQASRYPLPFGRPARGRRERLIFGTIQATQLK
jgi:hypothetical protein